MLHIRIARTGRTLGLACVIFLAACSLFEFTPYEVPPAPDAAPFDSALGPVGEGAYWRTDVNLRRLAALPPVHGKPWSMAVLSDPHQEYDALDEAVKHINSDPSIVLILVTGDFTQYGLAAEYRWFRDIMSGLNAPFLTVLGNHDALANGSSIYRNMFGPLDYSFTFRGIRFVCANTNIWEFESGVPNWTWLTAEVDAAPDSLRLFLVSHIPPFGDQFDSTHTERWRAITGRRKVELSINGHQHNYRFEETFGDGVPYLVADNTGDGEYAKVTVSDTGFSVERVRF